MTLHLTTVTGSWRTPDGSIPDGGTVTFRLSQEWQDEEDNLLIAITPVTVSLDQFGSISVKLFSNEGITDDFFSDTFTDEFVGTLSPVLPPYIVTESIMPEKDQTYELTIPFAGIDLSQVSR